MTSWYTRARELCVLLAVGTLAVCPPAEAQMAMAGGAPASAGGGAARAARAAAARTSAIIGSAWRADNSPIPQARLRLRNLVTGRARATAVASEAGEFEFRGIESGSYVVELVSEGGKVLTVGQTLAVAPGETIATFVRLGGEVRWFNGFFANAAAAIASTAAAAGITAMAPEQVRPVSARR